VKVYVESIALELFRVRSRVGERQLFEILKSSSRDIVSRR